MSFSSRNLSRRRNKHHESGEGHGDSRRTFTITTDDSIAPTIHNNQKKQTNTHAEAWNRDPQRQPTQPWGSRRSHASDQRTRYLRAQINYDKNNNEKQHIVPYRNICCVSLRNLLLYYYVCLIRATSNSWLLLFVARIWWCSNLLFWHRFDKR